ncbi:unnamed protein product [Paramecium sonneborni]|uniref:Transmembrane protein n=1 Tax=Paramecium sonneborni TaxID=65129 RepID=A0A8S1RTH2_9CILI|nr:unnamed protein product [Paramecium sonneborni]
MKLFHEALNFSDQICLSYDIYKRNFPLKINKITKNGITLQFLNQQSIQIPPYLLGIISFNRVLILNRFNEQLFIGLIQDNSIIKLIYFSNGQPIKQYQFQLPYVFNNNLLNLIEIYQLNLDQIKKSVYQTKKKIIKAIKLNFSIIYLLEDCIKVSIQFTQETFIFEQIQYSFDCTSSFQFYKQEIYIDAHSIIYNHTHYNIIKITLKEKIVQVNNVLQNHFLIFTYYNDQYSAKLFLFQIEEIIHLYTLPTYNYTIQFPIQYKIQMSILMIKVRKADQGFFLLIYDLKNTAVESLIQINAIDEEDNQSFDFIDEKEYFFSYQRQLQIQNLNQPCFFLKGLKEGQDFIEETQLIISTKSEISNENIDLEFHLIIINKNYTLQLLNLSQNILAGEILNQENIFGNIEEVEIIGSENISVYQPLIFNNISAICNFYQFGICIYDKSILRNIFDSNTFIKFSQDFVQLPFYIGFNSEDCSHAIYLKLDESLYMNEFNFCRNNQIQKQNYTISNNAHTMKIFKQINDLQMTGLDNGIILFYFQYKPFLNSVLLNSFINVDFDLFDGAKINDFTYFFLNIGFNVIELKVFNVTQLDHHNGAISDILYQQKYNLNNLFEKSQLIQKNSSKLQIYHVLKINNKFQIKFIIILKDNLAVLMQIILDLNNYNETIFEQLGMIRYENKAIFRKLLFIDLNYVILAFSQDQYRFINIFDINILKNKNIDSIQKFKDDNYNYVERYNESYFIIVEQVNVQEQRVHLITLDKFKIKCHGECSKPSYIKLSNQVSQILIELDFLNEKQINKDKLQSFIVVFTFICIVIRLFCKKEKKRREKQIIQH